MPFGDQIKAHTTIKVVHGAGSEIPESAAHHKEAPAPVPWASEMLQEKTHSGFHLPGFRPSTNVEDVRGDPTGTSDIAGTTFPIRLFSEFKQDEKNYLKSVERHEKAGDYDNPLSKELGSDAVEQILHEQELERESKNEEM